MGVGIGAGKPSDGFLGSRVLEEAHSRQPTAARQDEETKWAASGERIEVLNGAGESDIQVVHRGCAHWLAVPKKNKLGLSDGGVFHRSRYFSLARVQV